MIEILFFGRLADAMQARRLSYAGDAKTLYGLRDEVLAAALTGGHLNAGDIRMSVNQAQVFDDRPLTAGDEVAFFPVFSGG
ncbi:MAG: MoaD/ThiS family protein [Asticcacaulis sp.]|uniref:MoaD/ThiS family protein n=1 Tax=Asticcacaulis sp. TaxID=1872648 RepID=UPI003F7CC061